MGAVRFLFREVKFVNENKNNNEQVLGNETVVEEIFAEEAEQTQETVEVDELQWPKRKLLS